MALNSLPAGPDPATDTPQAFSEKAAAMVLAQKNLVEQWNAEIAVANALFAGGAYSFMYTFDSTASNADPGPGRLRMNSGTQSSANNIYIDPVTAGGGNIDDLLATIGAGTSVLKGGIRIVKANDPTRWAIYDINAVVASSGYRSLNVTWRAGSSASPFVNNDAVMVFLDRAGDVGNGAEVLIGSADITAPTALINFLTIFSALYSNYRIELNGITLSAAASVQCRVAVAGAAVSANYTTPVGEGLSSSGTVSNWTVGINSISPRTGTIEISNTNDSTTPAGFRYSGATQGTDGTTQYYTTARAAIWLGTNVLTGFQLALSTGNFTGGKVRVYGRRN